MALNNSGFYSPQLAFHEQIHDSKANIERWATGKGKTISILPLPRGAREIKSSAVNMAAERSIQSDQITDFYNIPTVGYYFTSGGHRTRASILAGHRSIFEEDAENFYSKFPQLFPSFRGERLIKYIISQRLSLDQHVLNVYGSSDQELHGLVNNPNAVKIVETDDLYAMEPIDLHRRVQGYLTDLQWLAGVSLNNISMFCTMEMGSKMTLPHQYYQSNFTNWITAGGGKDANSLARIKPVFELSDIYLEKNMASPPGTKRDRMVFMADAIDYDLTGNSGDSTANSKKQRYNNYGGAFGGNALPFVRSYCDPLRFKEDYRTALGKFIIGIAVFSGVITSSHKFLMYVDYPGADRSGISDLMEDNPFQLSPPSLMV